MTRAFVLESKGIRSRGAAAIQYLLQVSALLLRFTLALSAQVVFRRCQLWLLLLQHCQFLPEAEV